MNLFEELVMALLVVGLTPLAVMQAQDKRIKREELPSAVERTVAEQSKGAMIRGFSTEVERGKRIYEAELTVDGHGKDISIDEQGNIVEVEEEVSIDALPPAVRDGLRKAAGTGTIGKIEALTKNGKLVAYEAVVKRGAKRSEIQVGPDGRKLAHPE